MYECISKVFVTMFGWEIFLTGTIKTLDDEIFTFKTFRLYHVIKHCVIFTLLYLGPHHCISLRIMLHVYRHICHWKLRQSLLMAIVCGHVLQIQRGQIWLHTITYKYMYRYNLSKTDVSMSTACGNVWSWSITGEFWVNVATARKAELQKIVQYWTKLQKVVLESYKF